MADIRRTALFARLDSLGGHEYAGRIVELQDNVGGWLSYVSQTFPHFTRHTVEHSVEVASQISRLLFRDGDPARPVIELSALEIYVLLCGALLHDAGMVVSDDEKQQILGSQEWRDWISAGGGAAERWAAVSEIRGAATELDQSQRDFLADVAVRRLIAEWVRRGHHYRIVPILGEADRLGRAALDDPSLHRTISDVCVAHGLSRADLDDPHKYPDRRDVRGETANVRLLAILLRLGDLLDTSHERACPLLLGAASPLPADSLAHWNQYERIRHRTTAPDIIEVEAECETAEEHRLLQDWGQWLVDEVDGARRLMAGARRHGGWAPPVVSLEGSNPTIMIRPAPGARYIPADWKFVFDTAAVVDRLIHDVSPEPLLFVRELIQNALDATRRAAYDAVGLDGAPEDPTLLPWEIRETLPIRVEVATVEGAPGTEGSEPFDTVTIQDCGTGMSQETIRNYLLQIGRSYYTTPDFRKRYRFSATSRFGVGFLSVFRDSEHVTVETATQDDIAQGRGGIRLTVTGPRNYLLVEQGTRRERGTTVVVRLKQRVDPEMVSALVKRLCQRTEFPVVVNEFGDESAIVTDGPANWEWSLSLPARYASELTLRAFPVRRAGVAGEVYIVQRRFQAGRESWAHGEWATTLERGDPQVVVPEIPPSVISVNGLAVGSPPLVRGFSTRIDVRRPTPSLGLGRRGWVGGVPGGVPEVNAEVKRILGDHLDGVREGVAGVPGWDDWYYRQRLIRDFPLGGFWREVPETCPAAVGGELQLLSIAEVAEAPVVTVVTYIGRPDGMVEGNLRPRPIPEGLLKELTGVVCMDWHVNRWARDARRAIFQNRVICDLAEVSEQLIAIRWSQSVSEHPTFDVGGSKAHVVAVGSEQPVGFTIHRVDDWRDGTVINSDAPLIRWYVAIRDAVARGARGISSQHVKAVEGLLHMPLRVRGADVEKLNAYLGQWQNLGLPEELSPPAEPLVWQDFLYKRGGR